MCTKLQVSAPRTANEGTVERKKERKRKRATRRKQSHLSIAQSASVLVREGFLGRKTLNLWKEPGEAKARKVTGG